MNNQQGYVTLGVTLMMLVLVSLNSFMGVKGSILNQRSSNNAYYSEKAFQHAELGLNKVKANISQYLINNHSITRLSDIPLNLVNLSLANTYSTTLNGNQLVSTGYVNGVGLRKITQILTIETGADGAAALNALGFINLGGSTSATSIKAGGGITGNVPAQAFANSIEYKVAILDHSNKIIKDSLGNIIFRSMTSDEYFMYYFGGLCPNAQASYNDGDITKAVDCIPEAKNTVAANSKGYICDAADCSTKAEDDKISAAYLAGKRIFWLQNGGIDHKTSMGTEADPVLIFVMNIPDASKAAKINAQSTIMGVLYVDVLDSQININCSCSADAKITDMIVEARYEDDLTKPIYTQVSTGGTKCSTRSGCADSKGTLIPFNARYVVTYQQKPSGSSSKPVYGDFSNIGLNNLSPPACTLNSCQQGLSNANTTCTGGSAIGDNGRCSFVTMAVSGSNNIPVQIEITGTWDSSGSGRSVIEGAVLTSGNYQGTGNATYIKNSAVITNIIFGNFSGNGFVTKPPIMSASAWSDMN